MMSGRVRGMREEEQDGEMKRWGRGERRRVDVARLRICAETIICNREERERIKCV